ncbi:CopY/TcrY family copper transport repressor [uncultured Granulicatella sp.]|uniref:CopY/TcrY family copper transport repressor n=1 Tax=uncultured Granulicatella sp. TaxID=316089 RepID=UPI0025992C54|nr:CopY/TcrY family copper transport repressor [uncultured Granulicatella sp.]
MTEFQPMSPSERQVMRVLWANPSSTSGFIIEQLQKSFPWSESTVKTLIIRLTKKGYIQIDNRKKPFHYSATILEKEQLDQETDALLEQVCQKQNGNLLHTLINKATLSQEDIKVLVNALKEKAATAPTSVACNCLPGQCNCHHHH